MLLEFAKKMPTGMLEVSCRECGIKFLGYSGSLYCPEHKNIERKRAKEVTLYDHFKPLQLDIKENTIMEFSCDCCRKPFRYQVFIDTKVVPKFCELHRNQYKREYYETHKRN